MSLLTTGEAAERLGVTVSTVKRWVDAGEVRAERTVGGHRRIPESEVERLAAAVRGEAGAGGASRWADLLADPDSHRMLATLLALRGERGAWWRAAEEAAGGLVEVGERWECGACTVFEEHRFSESFRRAVAACAAGLPRRPDAPLAVLLTPHDERHTLGLTLAELVLAEAGWRTAWIGEGPPPEELPRLLGRLTPDLVLAAATACADPAHLAAYAAALAEAAPDGTPLAFGGGGAWPEPAPGRRVREWGELVEVAAERRPDADRSRR
jgi:MerR family transcriptional regulator, light-induced transcriptional regulator